MLSVSLVNAWKQITVSRVSIDGVGHDDRTPLAIGGGTWSHRTLRELILQTRVHPATTTCARVAVCKHSVQFLLTWRIIQLFALSPPPVVNQFPDARGAGLLRRDHGQVNADLTSRLDTRAVRLAVHPVFFSSAPRLSRLTVRRRILRP